MPVEEKGETDVIISKELIAQEKAKLAQLKGISAEKKKLVGPRRGTADERLEAKEAAKKTKLQAKKVKDLEKKLREMEKAQKEQISKIRNLFSKFGSFFQDPGGFVTERLMDVLKDNRWIPVLGAAIGLGLLIFKIMEKQFGDGGIFDLRVRIKDIVRSIVSLKNLMDTDAGVIFMTADTKLTMMPPETTNTEWRRDGHVKYNQLTLGYI